MAVERGKERKEELARMIIEGRAKADAKAKAKPDAEPAASAQAAAAADGGPKPAPAAENAGARRTPLTYEQLASIAGQLDRENAGLRQELGKAAEYVEGLQLGALLAYADRLFKVLEQSVWFDDGYVQSCAEALKGVVGLLGSAAVGGSAGAGAQAGAAGAAGPDAGGEARDGREA